MGTQEGITEAPEATTPDTAEAPTPKDWKENFTVKRFTEVEKVERLAIVVGVNEYKGQHLVFIAKVTDANFSRQFFSMPAYVWEKALTQIQAYSGEIAEIEKASMAEKALVELRRLAELGVDVRALVAQITPKKAK